jgi:hypothetical protein
MDGRFAMLHFVPFSDVLTHSLGAIATNQIIA